MATTKSYTFINIKEVLSRLLRHPLLLQVDVEAVIQYTIDFIGLNSYPSMYEQKETTVTIADYMALLPVDFIKMNQVKEKSTGICLRAMTNSFKPYDDGHRGFNSKQIEYSYKIQGNVIVTSFKEGDVTISYNAIPVDDNGFPKIINNAAYLRALELYVKREVFTILFDMNKITPLVLQNTLQQYCWASGQLYSEFNIPTMDEMESIKNSWCTIIQRSSEFVDGFKNLGAQEYIKQH